MKIKNFLTRTKKQFFLISLLLLSSIGFSQSFTLEAKVVGDPRTAGDDLGHFGGNCIYGDYMVVGAHLVDTIGFPNCGAALLYHWNDSTCVWELVDQIFAESAIGVSDIEANADFGVSVALENDIIAIGSRYRNNGFTDAGRVYIYRIIDDEAVFVQVLNARNNAVLDSDDREFNAQFGTSLKLHGQQLIIGAPFETEQDSTFSLGGAGAAYIYRWNVITELFDFKRKICAPIRASGDQFGNEVSIFANYAAVAAQFEDENELETSFLVNSGSVYVFKIDDVTNIWSFSHKLVAPDRATNDFFGTSVDMTQQHIVVGARQEDEDVLGGAILSNSGSAYIYEWDFLGEFTFEQKIVASDRNALDNFGFLVSISNNQILVGAPSHGFDAFGSDFLENAGAAYLFKHVSGVWSQTQKLDAFDRRAGDLLGEAISIHENKIMVGSYANDLDENGLPPLISSGGAAYIFSTGNKPVITAIHSNQEGICDGQPITLSVEGVLYDAFEWEWFEGGCDGTSLGTGTEITVSPLTTKTYCVRANGCFNYIEAEDCECIDVIIKPGYWHQTTAAGLKEDGNDLVTDSEGNVYITGTYSGFATFDGGEFSSVTVDHDPGLYTTTIKSYLAKYDNCGNLLWVTYSEGNSNDDYAHGIALHEIGNNLYIVGEFTNQITFRNGLGDFGFGSGTVTRTMSGMNGYVAKVDKNNGKVMYIDAVWSTGSKSKLTAITINENNGRIFVAGQTYDDVGYEKVFIHKYAPSYITLNTAFWKAVSTTYNGAIINAMDFDESSPEAGENGALWVIGDFKSSFHMPKFFVGSFLTLISSATERDAFVLKYMDSFSFGTNPTGVFLKNGNITNIAGNKMLGIDIAVEKETGNAFLTGTKKGTCSPAFSLPFHNLPIAFGIENGYFIGIRADGSGFPGLGFKELSYPSGVRNSSGKGVIIQNGVVYFIGSRGSESYFDDGLILASTLLFYGLSGDEHIYVVAYNSATGAYLWSNGTTNPAPVLLANHQPMAITADGAGHLFITGYFQSEMGYIDGTPASGNLTSVSNANLFAMRVDIEGVGAEDLQKPSFVDFPIIGEVEVPGENENNDFKASFDLSLVPNPTNSFTKLIITNFQENQLYEIMIFTSDGRTIYQGQLNQESTAFDLTNFSSGLYTVVVYSNNEVVFKKLLKTT
jgi:hypothetical protein